MTDWIDRMIGESLSRAGRLFEEEQDLGRQMWSKSGWRCYEQERPTGGTLTLRDSGGSLTYELVGLSPRDLK